MNSIVLSGRLVRSPELKHTSSGQAVAEFRIAVDRAGMKQEDGTYGAGFFNVTVWGNQAENVAQYLEKGSRAAVQGELRFREWEGQDGTKRTAVEVNARWVEFLETRAEREERQAASGGQTEPAAAGVAAGQTDFGSGTADFGGGNADDDIPF